MSLGVVLERLERRTIVKRREAPAPALRNGSPETMLEAVIDAVEAATGKSIKRSDFPSERTLAKRVARAIVSKNEGAEARTQEERSMHALIVLQSTLKQKLLGFGET